MEKSEAMVTLSIQLTEDEASYLSSEMNSILREFGSRPYNGRQFTNPVMASAFNKVFKALAGRDHENCSAENMEIMKKFHSDQSSR